MIVYLTFCSWVFLASIARSNSILNSKYTSRLLVFLFIGLAAITIPRRDLYQGDMINYFDDFREMQSISFFELFQNFSREPLFLIIQWVISRFTESIEVYVVLTWVVYAIVMIKAVSKLVQPNNVIFILFGYLNFTFFYEYLLVGSRQGFAMVFMVLMISCWLKPTKPILFYLAAAATILCHYSSAPVVAILLLLKWRNITLSTSIKIWIIAALLFVTRVHETIMLKIFSSSQFFSSYTSSNLLNQFGYTANRTEYLLFSGAVIVAGLMLSKFVIQSNKEIYNKLITSFALINCYFLLFGFIAFAVRIAVFSWFMIPLLLWYPIINQEKVWLKIVATALTFAIGTLTTIQYFN